VYVNVMCLCVCMRVCVYTYDVCVCMSLFVIISRSTYGVAKMGRLLQIIGLFCRIGLFCKRDLQFEGAY